MRIVLCTGHVLYLTHSDDGAFEVTAATLDELRAEVLELLLMLVELDGVAFDGTNSTAGYDVGIKTVLFHSLFLLHGRAVRHIESLAECPFNVVIVGWQVEEVLVKELDMRLGFHYEVGFLQAALGKEGNVTVEDVDLTALLTDELGTLIDSEDADDRACRQREDDGHQGQFGFLF